MTTGPSPARNPAWGREELVLALDLYQHPNYPNGTIPKGHADLLRVSDQLNQLLGATAVPDAIRYRNPNGVYMKVQNFKPFDPYYED